MVKESKKNDVEKDIVKVNELNKGDSFTELSAKYKSLQKRIEKALGAYSDKKEEKRRILNEEKAARALASAPEKKAKPLPRQPIEEPVSDKKEMPVQPERVETKPAPDQPKVSQAPSAEDTKPVKSEAQPVKAPAKTEPAPKSGVTQVEIRTKTFDAVPTYIKGVYVPQPMPKPAPKQPGQRQNKQLGDKKQFGDRKPFNKTGTGAPLGDRKPQSDFAHKKPMGGKLESAAAILPQQSRRAAQHTDKKRDYNKGEEKKAPSKRTLIRQGFVVDDMGEERMGTRKLKNKKVKQQPVFAQPQKIEKAVITTENLTVKILSEKIGKTAQEIIKQLMILGIMTNINSVVDFPTMELVANELGVQLELKLDKTKEEQLTAQFDEADKEEDLVKRPPIITVMGHVDHGKTSLLDAIRKTSVASGEAGGITQHIGAYSVMCKGEKITFLDTPGHEAFTEMRARGAMVTDIAVLIVAADDGVMPQTVEAINHAKAAKVPIVVAINKIDKPGANIDRVKQKLMEYDLVPEEWGGDVMMVPVSAKTGEGIDKLLETILFLAEYNNYRANPKRSASGSVIESRLDKGKGPVANVIVQNGTLHVGDYVVSGFTSGRVRAMTDDKGRNIKEAGPSSPISLLGFADVPNAGDPLYVVSDEKTAKQIIDERTTKLKNEQANQGQKVSLDDVWNKISEGKIKELNLIIKADVQGSVEALKGSLEKLSNEEVKVVVVHGGVGAINKSDLMLAGVSNAIIIGFNVRPDSESKAMAENMGIDIRLYNVIYDAVDDVNAAMKGLIAPKFEEKIMGRAQVRNVFKLSSVGEVAGSYVISGKIVRNGKVRIYRDDVVIFDGNINNLKRFKDDVKEVAQGYECGISVENFSGFKENDEIEAYVVEEKHE